MKRKIITIISCILAVLFTVYISLDTFVISYKYEAVTEKIESEEIVIETQDSEITNNAVITADSYSDENISITITSSRVNDTDIYIADILLSDVKYLKTAFAESSYGKNVTATTSEMAEENNAILAINGDYYGSQEKGYVIRNGVLYRNQGKGDQEDLVIYKDGSMEIINENDITAEELLENGAENVLCFGPGLIRDGKIIVSETEEVDKARSSNPRTAIGIIDDLHYIFIVADGRTDQSEGLTLYQLAEVLESYNVKTAYNLDGGGSSTMVFNNQLVNIPTSGSYGKHKSNSSERSVSDIVYIGYE